MREASLIAAMTFRLLTRSSFFYLLLFCLGVVLASMLALSPELLGASAFMGNQGIAKFLKSIPRIFLSFWSLAVFVYSLQLSTTILPNEISERSNTAILSRPISRVQFLAGKWLGLFAFVCLCISLGKVAEVVHSLSLGMRPAFTSVAALAFFQDLVSSCMMPALGLALTAILPAGAGLVWTFLISVVFVYHPERFIEHSWASVRWFAQVCSVAFPISMQGSRYSSGGAESNLLIHAAVLGENVLVILALFLLSALAFLRRDLRS